MLENVSSEVTKSAEKQLLGSEYAIRYSQVVHTKAEQDKHKCNSWLLLQEELMVG